MKSINMRSNTTNMITKYKTNKSMTEFDRVLVSYEEQEFWMTRLDLVESQLNLV